jgi:hypothetical protein
MNAPTVSIMFIVSKPSPANAADSAALAYTRAIVWYGFAGVTVFVILLFFFSAIDSYNTYPSIIVENIFTALIWFLFSTNPFFAATMSEVILIDEQSLFMTTNNIIGSSSFPLPSPWIIYVAFYTFLTILLIGLSIYFVNRPDR